MSSFEYIISRLTGAAITNCIYGGSVGSIIAFDFQNNSDVLYIRVECTWRIRTGNGLWLSSQSDLNDPSSSALLQSLLGSTVDQVHIDTASYDAILTLSNSGTLHIFCSIVDMDYTESICWIVSLQSSLTTHCLSVVNAGRFVVRTIAPSGHTDDDDKYQI